MASFCSCELIFRCERSAMSTLISNRSFSPSCTKPIVPVTLNDGDSPTVSTGLSARSLRIAA